MDSNSPLPKGQAAKAGAKFTDFPPNKLRKGMKTEMREHGVDAHTAKSIASDHLVEKPHEYDKEAAVFSYYAMADELAKIAFEIKPEERTAIPKKDFAQPNKEEEGHKGKYPIPDKQHAKSALGFAKMHHDRAAYEAVKKKVHDKFPDMDTQGPDESGFHRNETV